MRAISVTRRELIAKIDRWLEQLESQEIAPTHMLGMARKAFPDYEHLLGQALQQHAARYFQEGLETLVKRSTVKQQRVDKMTQGDILMIFDNLASSSLELKEIFGSVKGQMRVIKSVRNRLMHENPPLEDIENDVQTALKELKALLSQAIFWSSPAERAV